MRHEKAETYVVHFDDVPNLNQWAAIIEEAGGVYIIGKSIGRRCVIVYAATPAVHERVELFATSAAG